MKVVADTQPCGKGGSNGTCSSHGRRTILVDLRACSGMHSKIDGRKQAECKFKRRHSSDNTSGEHSSNTGCNSNVS